MNVIREINLVFLAEENVLRNEYNLPVFATYGPWLNYKFILQI